MPVRGSDIRHAARYRRLRAGGVLLLAGAVLLLAAWFEPDPRGMGTHEQLNLPGCGMMTMFDLPCATCGMTTAFAHVAEGHVLAGLRVQPLGCVMAMGTAMTFLVSIYVCVTGAAIQVRVMILHPGTVLWWVLVSILLAWGYTILQYRDWI